MSRDTGLMMAFQLCRAAERTWQVLNAPKRMAEIIEGIKFVNGDAVKKLAA